MATDLQPGAATWRSPAYGEVVVFAVAPRNDGRWLISVPGWSDPIDVPAGELSPRAPTPRTPLPERQGPAWADSASAGWRRRGAGGHED